MKAEPPPPPRREPAQALRLAAQAVQAAWEERDEGALRALGAAAEPDPWLVADLLCAQRHQDAALAFARATPRTDTERLPDYVEGRRGVVADDQERGAVERGWASFQAGDADGALRALPALREPLPDALSIHGAVLRGILEQRRRRLAESRATLTAAAEAAGRLGWLHEAAEAYHEAGATAFASSDFDAAEGAWERAAALHARRGARLSEAGSLANLGVVAIRRGDFARARERLEAGLPRFREAADAERERIAIQNLGLVYFNLGDLDAAERLYGEAIASAHAAGDARLEASALVNAAAVRKERGDLRAARDALDRATSLFERLEDRAGVAAATDLLGVVLRRTGNLGAARDHHERALAEMRALGDRRGAAVALGNLGLALREAGALAEALRAHQEAHDGFREIGDRSAAAAALDSIAQVYFLIGDLDRAVDHQTRALEAYRALGAEADAGRILGNLANLVAARGEIERAVDLQRQSYRAEKKAGNAPGAAASIANLGILHRMSGQHERAVEFLDRARGQLEALGAQRDVALLSLEIGTTYRVWGKLPEARAHLEQSLALLREAGDREGEMSALAGLARVHLQQGDPASAGRLAREAVGHLPQVLGRLGEEHGAIGRSLWSGVFEVGLSAALSRGDPEEAFHFAESGRAGTLLESLRGLDTLREAVVPPDLRRQEAEARAELHAAERARRENRRASPEAARASRSRLRAAEEALEEAMARIEREAKAAAGILQATASPPTAVRAALLPGECLVLYTFALGEAHALVLTREEGPRAVALGPAGRLEAACAAAASQGGWSDEERIAEVRRLVWDPLLLPGSVHRVVISPVGALGSIPFCVLDPHRELALTPSGTVFEELRGRPRGPDSKDVLALGDPARDGADPWGGLEALPATREEAMQVGQVVLLGQEATRGRLRAALSARPHWRAVHFACHGLIDRDRPLRSALVLAPEPGDDGLLTALEVLRLPIRTEAAVLSACDTAMGRDYPAEGTLGLVRAFLVAGAPRVLASLWKVEDEATRALMTRFYETWGEEEGRGAAHALRIAQAHVRSLEREVVDAEASRREGRPQTRRVRPWEHPRYWAAWVLWGLPD